MQWRLARMHCLATGDRQTERQTHSEHRHHLKPHSICVSWLIKCIQTFWDNNKFDTAIDLFVSSG